MGKNLSSKFIKKKKKVLVSAKKPTTDAIKTASKRAIQKTAGATGDLIGNKIADKIIIVLKKSSVELRSKLHSQINEANDELETLKERCISPKKKKDNKLLMI